MNTEGDYDFLAVRIPNHDAWYLVPQEELLNSANAKFYPHNSKSKGKYEKYRDGEGWFEVGSEGAWDAIGVI